MKIWYVLLGSAAFFAAACTEEYDPAPDPPTFKNELIVNQDTFPLQYGEILRLEPYTAGVYYAPIYIISDEFILSDSTISGTGQALEMVVVTDRGDHITPGHYSFRDDIYTSTILIPGTFIAGLFLDWDLADWSVAGFCQGKSGTLDVTYTNGIYTFELHMLADLYDIGHAGNPPVGDPLETDVQIHLTFKSDMVQRYFG